MARIEEGGGGETAAQRQERLRLAAFNAEHATVTPTVAPPVVPLVSLPPRVGLPPDERPPTYSPAPWVQTGFLPGQARAISTLMSQSLPPDMRPPTTVPQTAFGGRGGNIGFMGPVVSPIAEGYGAYWAGARHATRDDPTASFYELQTGVPNVGLPPDMRAGLPNRAAINAAMGLGLFPPRGVPRQQPDRYSPNLALTLPGSTPWYEMPKPEDKPILTGYGGGTWSGRGGGGGGGGTTRGGGYGSGLIRWRITYG